MDGEVCIQTTARLHHPDCKKLNHSNRLHFGRRPQHSAKWSGGLGSPQTEGSHSGKLGGSADTAAALGLGLHFTARTNPVLDQQLTQWYTINSQLGLPQGRDVALKCTGKCKPLQSVLLPPFKNKAVLNMGTQQEKKHYCKTHCSDSGSIKV